MTTSARLLALCAAILASLALTSPAAASHRPDVSTSVQSVSRADLPGMQRFFGQVASVLGSAASPAGINVQLQDGRTVTIRLTARTTLRPRSAEAQVEGLLAGDFAVVYSVRSGADWSARRVLFDVDPFGPIRFFTITGSVSRFDRTGNRILLSVGGGTTRWIIMTAATRYAVDGTPWDTAPILVRGTVLQVDVRVTARGWVAVLINMKTSKSAPQGR